MTKNRNRDRVLAEITVFHLMRQAIENRCPVSQEQALVFFNQEDRVQEMWKHMMQAGLDFITSSYYGSTLPHGHRKGSRLFRLFLLNGLEQSNQTVFLRPKSSMIPRTSLPEWRQCPPEG